MYSSKGFDNTIQWKHKSFINTFLCPFVGKSRPHPALKTTDLFSVSKDLPLQGCPMNGTIQYVAYESGFLHITKLFCVSVVCSFYWLVQFHCIDISLFMHYPAEGYLGCFQFWVNMNKAAKNIFIQIEVVYHLNHNPTDFCNFLILDKSFQVKDESPECLPPDAITHSLWYHHKPKQGSWWVLDIVILPELRQCLLRCSNSLGKGPP